MSYQATHHCSSQSLQLSVIHDDFTPLVVCTEPSMVASVDKASRSAPAWLSHVLLLKYGVSTVIGSYCQVLALTLACNVWGYGTSLAYNSQRRN